MIRVPALALAALAAPVLLAFGGPAREVYFALTFFHFGLEGAAVMRLWPRLPGDPQRDRRLPHAEQLGESTLCPRARLIQRARKPLGSVRPFGHRPVRHADKFAHSPPRDQVVQ